MKYIVHIILYLLTSYHDIVTVKIIVGRLQDTENQRDDDLLNAAELLAPIIIKYLLLIN
jgi:hypothetical protein